MENAGKCVSYSQHLVHYSKKKKKKRESVCERIRDIINYNKFNNKVNPAGRFFLFSTLIISQNKFKQHLQQQQVEWEEKEVFRRLLYRWGHHKSPEMDSRRKTELYFIAIILKENSLRYSNPTVLNLGSVRYTRWM